MFAGHRMEEQQPTLAVVCRVCGHNEFRFAGLRWLDAEGTRLGLRGIAAMPVPETGLGAAINDRLVRAAAPRGG